MDEFSKKIKRDELEALGDLAAYVGEGLTKIVELADSNSRRNLFKTGSPDPRNVIVRALGKDLNNVHSVENQTHIKKPDPINNMPHTVLPLTNKQLSAITMESISDNDVIDDELSNLNRTSKPQTEQLEFEFIERIIHPFGSVKDIITHFDNRLDEIERVFKKILTFVNEIKVKIEKDS